MHRNLNRNVLINDHPLYKKKAEDRGLQHFIQYGVASMAAPTPGQVAELTTIPHIWSHGDKYYKLAAEYYGDPTYWWVIAWFNEKPTDGHLSVGMPVYIPLPLEQATSIYNS